MLAEGDVDPTKTFGSFHALAGKKKALRICVAWTVRWRRPFEPEVAERGLLLFGGTGVGKTHLANAVAYEMIVRHGIFARVLKTVRIPRNDADELLRLTDPDEVPVLVLDDLGAEKLTERALECLYILVDGRLTNRAPTVVTTNYEPEALKEWLGDEYGDRLLGRLREMCEFVPVGGDDMREKM